MELDKAHCCCFTGHRPEKLVQPEEKLRAMLSSEIIAAIDDGYTIFISGMARGADIIAAEAVLQIKTSHPEINLVCAHPYASCSEKFRSSWRARSLAIEQQASLTINVSTKYYRGCFQKRNEWMVENSSRIIALFNGTFGGTHNTISYAQAHGLDVRLILVP